MNQHGCSAGWATDEIFLCQDVHPINSTSPPCDAPLYAYIAIASALAVTRMIANINQARVWMARERARAQLTGHRRRLPVVVVMGTLTVLIFITFIVLTSLDFVKCSNGTSGVMIFLLFAPLTIQAVFFTRRIVILGRRAIPLTKAQLTLTDAQEQQLAKMDGVLVGFTVVGVICMVVAPVAFLIHPGFPGSFTPIAVGTAAYGIMNITLCAGMAYHIGRMLELMSATASPNTSAELNLSTTRARVKAKRVLRNQQIFIIGAGYPVAIYWLLLASDIIPFPWWAALILFAPETLVAFFFSSRFGGVSRRREITSSKTGSPSPPAIPDRKAITQHTLFGTTAHNGTPINKAAEDATFSIMDDGQVANIDGATISVVQHEIVDVDVNDTFLPKAAKKALHVSQYLVHRSIRYTFAFLISGLLSALLAIVLATDQIAAAIVFLIVVTLGCLALFLTTLSKKVLVELWHTDFLRFRIVVTLLGTGLLTDSLGGTSDARSMLAPALGMLQLVAFCTDALVSPLFRSSILWCAHHTTFITWVFIFWDLVPNMRNTIIPIGSGYSLLQASRDILLAQWSLFVIEGRFLSRGRVHKRFLHVTRPVEKVLLSCVETQSRETVRQHKRMGNASSVMMQSGFVLHHASQTAQHEDQAMANVVDGESPTPHKARVRVYVNKVAVKQASAILFTVFGSGKSAITAYSYLDGITGRVLHAVALVLPLVTAIVLPFVPKSVSYPLCWICIPCTIIISLRQLSLLSTTMAKLLIARVTFLPVVGLMLGWMVLMCVVLGDARCAVATFGALTYIWCDVLGDASTTTPATYRVARIFTTMGASPTILVLSIYFLADQFVDVANVDWSVKALGETNSTQSNAPEVIDASQLVGDFGFFSIAIPVVLQAIQVMLTFFKGSDGKSNFKSIAAPVMPNYVQDKLKDEVTVATTTLPVTDEAKDTTPNDQSFPPVRPVSIAMSQSHRSYRSQDELKKHISLVVKRMENTIAANDATADGGDSRTMVQVDIEPEIIW